MTGVSTLDLAKAMIDEGFHPMTMYFPLVVHGALLVEPTESETKATLDQFVASLTALAQTSRMRKSLVPWVATRRSFLNTFNVEQISGSP